VPEAKYITHEEAMAKADSWQKVRLAMYAHEMTILALGRVDGADAFVSRSTVYEAIGEHVRGAAGV
jgi:hypothetical protein